MKIADSPEEPDFVDQLLQRQDEVIAELDHLETAILSVIDELGSQRKDSEEDAQETDDRDSVQPMQSSHSKAA